MGVYKTGDFPAVGGANNLRSATGFVILLVTIYLEPRLFQAFHRLIKHHPTSRTSAILWFYTSQLQERIQFPIFKYRK